MMQQSNTNSHLNHAKPITAKLTTTKNVMRLKAGTSMAESYRWNIK